MLQLGSGRDGLPSVVSAGISAVTENAFRRLVAAMEARTVAMLQTSSGAPMNVFTSVSQTGTGVTAESAWQTTTAVTESRTVSTIQTNPTALRPSECVIYVMCMANISSIHPSIHPFIDLYFIKKIST